MERLILGGESSIPISSHCERPSLQKLSTTIVSVGRLVKQESVITDFVLALILVYDYHPLSTTLWEEYLSPAPEQNGPNTLASMTASKKRSGMPIPERVIWSYITQIANALKAIHSSNLAVRNLDPSKILITGKNRIRLNGCGVLDVLAYDAQNLALHQVGINHPSLSYYICECPVSRNR